MDTSEQALMKELESITNAEGDLIEKDWADNNIQLVRLMKSKFDEEYDPSKTGTHFFIGTKVDNDDDKGEILGGMLEGDHPDNYSKARVGHAFSMDKLSDLYEFLDDKITLCVLSDAQSPVSFVTQVYTKTYEMTILTAEQFTVVLHQAKGKEQIAHAVRHDRDGIKTLKAVLSPTHLKLVQELCDAMCTPIKMKKNHPKMWQALMEEAKEALQQRFGEDNDE